MAGGSGISWDWAAKPLAPLVDAGVILRHAARRFSRDKGFVSASALTYTTLLALVPLLTVVFAIFTAFPAYGRVRKQAETLLFQNLVPQVGDQIQAYAGTFVAKAGALTGFGIIGLTVSAILLFFSIESALNSIWRAAEPRPLLIRLLSFWAVLTMAPLVLGGSLSLGLGAMAQMKIGGSPVLIFLLSLSPLLFETLAFSFMYMAIPNREVGWRDALTGGAVAGLATELAKTGFSLYVTLFPTYEAIYGAVSVVPIFLLWLYLLWSIVLFGAEVAASLPEWRAGRLNGEEGGLSNGQRLMVALAILDTLHQASRHGVGLKRDAVARRVPVGGAVIDDMLETLRRAHWVERSGRGAWMVSRDMNRATLADLRLALELAIRGENGMRDRLGATWAASTADMITNAEQAGREMLNVSLATIFASQNDLKAPAETA